MWVYLRSPLVSHFTYFFQFLFVYFPLFISLIIPVFLPSFLCLPLTPTVQCMLKLSLEGACIVPACEFLISSDMGPEDLASAFNAKAPCLCLWS